MVVNALAVEEKLSWETSDRFEAEIARWDFSPGHTVWLAKPLTFMNESGRAIQKLAAFHKVVPASITVVYDDLTIDLGLLKVSVKGSAGGHNGIADLLARMGDGFVRYRLGIGPKLPREMDLKDYVLGRFSDDQQTIFNQQLPRFLSGLRTLLTQGPDQAMNQLNRRILPT
jgi:PTH1 family peptidyl-tRNA hydrolase